MNKYNIRAVHIDGARLPEQEIEAECPQDALEIFGQWTISALGFSLCRLQCIDIDKMQRIGHN